MAGVSGYAGGELARLLLGHSCLTADSLLFLGRPVSSTQETEPREQTLDDLHPQLLHLTSTRQRVVPFSWQAIADFGADILLLATPHEQSREWVPTALARGLRVIDLSGAWRLQDDTNRAVYKFIDADPAAAATLQRDAVYGSPELHRERVRAAALIANPGCYATSVLLALAPFVDAGVIDLEHGIVADAKSGVSGAGKAATAKTHFMYAADNLSAYAVFGHRHTGELLEQLHLSASDLQFTPHLLPIPRGILSTVYLRLRGATTSAAIEEMFHDFYATSPMVRVRPAGSLPQIQHVVRTSFCDLGFELGPDNRRLVVVSCLDNLLKGAAGQAVQNMNLMLGWAETEGLL